MCSYVRTVYHAHDSMMKPESFTLHVGVLYVFLYVCVYVRVQYLYIDTCLPFAPTHPIFVLICPDMHMYACMYIRTHVCSYDTVSSPCSFTHTNAYKVSCHHIHVLAQNHACQYITHVHIYPLWFYTQTHASISLRYSCTTTSLHIFRHADMLRTHPCTSI
jgi:hypothetical protein